ncbi:DHH family phosphoesterase [Paenibacillus sp. XY044]|uniref:DHH family phosphoesterase n=1 Tax=Paenibacillus sp. XY044 TaxID=2026089 RepID=UPI000B98D731|nr:DHH family phosphoesterase [Paenibacillus sp. XY044]OZB98137.1 hypothetical protein CJP46_02915 [Paenibacillus sp. XY044]
MIIIGWKLKQPKIPYSDNDILYGKLAKINGIENIDQFLNPLSNVVHSPYLLKNVDALSERIIRAIKNGEKIVIFGDCDFDGLVSGITLYKYLLNFTDNIELKYVERSSGHGTANIITEVPRDTNLYIAVDSSSNDVEEMKLLQSKGIDCLIIDHHSITNPNPYALIVNPQQEGCSYPNKHASGGLLVWKVCSVLDDYMDTDFARKYSDVAGFSLAADMMSMRELENRYYLKNALKFVKHPGLKALFKEMNFDTGNLYANDFVYGVSPAVTAATRADKIGVAIDFLMCDEESPKLPGLVKELVKLNEERKVIQAEALERLKPSIDPNDKVIIVYDSSIGKGYNGLVAQEISKKYSRPAIVLGDGDEEGIYSGSFRGLESFPLLDILSECKFITFAVGHPGAGGTGVKIENLGELRNELNNKLGNVEFDETQYYDLEFHVDEIDERFIKYIAEFYRVSGMGFKEGKFLVKGLFVEDKKPLGKTKNTVMIDCGNLKLMKFKTDKEFYDKVPVFSEIEAIGSLNVNEFWRYNKAKRRRELEKTNQLFIDDYRVVN